MQDESAAKGLNPVLERHWEKIVLGLVGVAALAFLVAQFSAGKNPAVQKLEQANATFEKKKKSPNPAHDAVKPAPKIEIAAIPATKTPAAWGVGVQTKFTYEIVRGEGPKSKEFLFPDVTMGDVKEGTDGVELRWQLGKTGEAPKGAIVVKPETFWWQVERRLKGGAWEVVEPKLRHDPKATDLKWFDSKIKPKTHYEYRVTLGSNDPMFVAAQSPSGITRKVTNPVNANTPGLWSFSFSNATPANDEDTPKPATVYVTITKHDPEAGTVEWRRIQKPGQLLGTLEDGNSVHAVFSKKLGKTVNVDFKSGGKLGRVTVDKLVPYEYKVCNPALGAGGVMVCAGPETRKDHYKINEVQYTDEDGKTQIDQRPSGPAPNPDRLCPDHGGPPPARELTAEEKANELLERADELWKTNKPSSQKEAQAIYRRILESYPELASIKARKPEITERSKKKVE